ncbi:hypothetical protein BJ508DRAFT_177674 [Ascobolus immersus RN42]|uniref:Uncharacterized protein n=1 Tax=Ascobolus immersus RN42 TaxID=1160509 RepID=A0A3N4IIR3_ASCIM|nr:hypothetical protein BJ508DRAFT_177674 [Ascobolus immersus RN42]
MTGATYHETRRNEDAFGDITMLRRSLSLERKKEDRGVLLEEDEEEEEMEDSVGQLRSAAAPGTLSPSSSSSSLRSDLSSSSGGSAASQPRSASPSTLGPLLSNLKIGMRPTALRPSSPSRMQATLQRHTPPPSPSSPLTPTHYKRPPRPTHLRSKSSSTITTFEAAPFLLRSVSHPGPRSPYRFNPTPLNGPQMFTPPLSAQSSYSHLATPRSRPTSPNTFARATPSPPPSLYYDSYPDSHPATPRSRSPSISSLETIPDTPDAEQEAELEPIPVKRSLSMGRQLGMNGKMDRKRWSVCGAEKRTDLNLETIWEDDMFAQRQGQGGVRILDEERMVDTVSEIEE